MSNLNSVGYVRPKQYNNFLNINLQHFIKSNQRSIKCSNTFLCNILRNPKGDLTFHFISLRLAGQLAFYEINYVKKLCSCKDVNFHIVSYLVRSDNLKSDKITFRIFIPTNAVLKICLVRKSLTLIWLYIEDNP